MTSSSTGLDPPSPAGVVELREDVPLKGAAEEGARRCGGGPRLIAACFGALSAAITVALLAQVHSGDYEVVPHGSVSSDAAACSAAGTDALKAGGRALDAAAAAALCLAVVAPHATSLDASGALLYWEYRGGAAAGPSLARWGGADEAGAAPRLLAALAALHAARGALPWPRLLQPAITLARDGYVVSESLAAALNARAGAGAAAVEAGSVRTAPELAAVLEALQHNTSQELNAAWGGAARQERLAGVAAGAGRLYSASAAAARAVAAALQPPPADLDDASRRVLAALLDPAAGLDPADPGPASVASGLAVVDRLDTYVALVTGLSEPFGSGPESAAGWRRDRPAGALDLAPAVLLDGRVCGTRYVMGAESSAALAQAAVALAAGGPAPAAVERARVAVRGGSLWAEAGRPVPGALPVAPPVAPPPYAAVNVVQQTADDLLSYADSRGGGLSSRF